MHGYNCLRQEVVPCLQTVESADIQKSMLFSLIIIIVLEIGALLIYYWRGLYLAISIAIFRGNHACETAHWQDCNTYWCMCVFLTCKNFHSKERGWA